MRRGFTMVEMLLSIMILAIMTIVSTMVFHTVVRNWTLATEMADNMQRVDYITAQVTYAIAVGVVAFRSVQVIGSGVDDGKPCLIVSSPRAFHPAVGGVEECQISVALFLHDPWQVVCS